MANTTITNLPTVTALTGAEPLLGVQSGSSVQITTGQIASLAIGQSGFPFAVNIGGTGRSSFTTNGVVFGNGTSPLGVTAAGTTGQVLVGNTGSAPTWSSTIPSTAGVTSLSLGTTGLTPTAATTGAITVGFGSSPTDAGIYSPASQQIALSTANVGRLFITATGNVGVGTGSPFYPFTVKPSAVGTSTFGIGVYDSGSGGANTAVYAFTESFNNDGYGDGFYGGYSRGTNASRLAVQSGDGLSYFGGSGWDGAQYLTPAYMEFLVDGAVSSGNIPTAITFRTGTTNPPLERMRITSAGNVGIGNNVATATTNLTIGANITGGTSAYGVVSQGVIQSGVTSASYGVVSSISTAVASFTVGEINHFMAVPNVGGAGSTVTTQIGFRAHESLGTQGAATVTNAYGFFGNIASGSNRWNLYMNGTANNYLAGNLGIGTTSLANVELNIGGTITGGTTAFGMSQGGVVQSGVTTAAVIYQSSPSLAAAAFTTQSLIHFYANPAAGGAGSIVNNNTGFFAEDTLRTAGGATVNNSYGFYGNIAAGANRWNLFMGGTASNYLEGNLGIGVTVPGVANLNIAANITGGTTAYSILNQGVVQSGVTTSAIGNQSAISLAAAAFTTSSVYHFYAAPNSGGAGSTITNQVGFIAESTLGTAGAATVTNAYGFLSNIASGANRWNFFAGGTANNAFNGNVRIGSTAAPTVALDVTGAALISTTLGVTTSLTTPLHVGGTAANSTLTLQSTSGVGTTDSVVIRTGNNGAVTAATFNTAGAATSVNWYNTATQTATNTATLSAAQITGPFLLGTPTATASYTLPTASALDTALGVPPVETGWEFVVFTTAAFAITLLTNTGWTLVGSMATGATANSFARYRVRKTAATPTFTIYRIG